MTRLQVTTYTLGNNHGEVLEEARAITNSTASLMFTIPKASDDNLFFQNEIAVGVEIEELAGKTYGPLTYTRFGEVGPRYVFKQAQGSVIDKGDEWQYTLPAISAGGGFFGDMPIIGALGNKLKYGAADNPYTVMANRVAEAKARGMDRKITVVDGGGWTSPNACTNIEFDDLAPLSDFYTALKDGLHADLVWVGTTLYVLPPGAMSFDRADMVQFQDEDFTALPVELDYSKMCDSVIIIGDNGSYAVYPPGAPGKVKRIQYSGVSDIATLNLIAQREWADRQAPLRQITASLAMPSTPTYLPFRDYHEGTIVQFPTETGDVESIKIAQITTSRDIEPDFGTTLILDTKIKSNEVRRVELGKLASGSGAEVSGNGSLLAPVTAFTGEIRFGFWAVAPAGWGFATGPLLNKADYPALYQVYGDMFGTTGNPATFRGPDFRDATIFGYDAGNALFNVLGRRGGEERVTLTPGQGPKHRHNLGDSEPGYAWGWGAAKGTVHINEDAQGGASGGGTNQLFTSQGAWNQTTEAGNNESHNNIPTNVTVMVIFKY